MTDGLLVRDLSCVDRATCGERLLAVLALQSAFGFLAFLAHRLAALRKPARLSRGASSSPARCSQIVLAALLLKVPVFKALFLELNDALLALEKATQAGTRFVFGFLGGGEQPFEERPGTSSFVLAFRALPLMLVVSALTSLLFYWRILPAVVRAMSAVLERAMGVGGAVGLSAGGQHLRRHGRSAALRAALSQGHEPRGAFHRHGLRHGRDRRHGDGDLCERALAHRARRDGPYPLRVRRSACRPRS